MKMRVQAIMLCAVLIAAPAAGQAPADLPRLPSVTLPAELDRVLRDYERHWAGGDSRALSLLFTDDGFVSGATGWIRGRAQIAAHYARAGGALRLRAVAYSVDGAAGYIVGAYGYGDSAADVDSGKFVLALRRAPDGQWLIAADLDSSNRRPEPDGS